MKKTRLTASYAGNCYIKAYGRKQYKHGVRLTNVSDGTSTLFQAISVGASKALKVLDVSDVGKDIAFEAVVEANSLKYISNVRVIDCEENT
jgi:c-di-GMP-binding flagellar brake protein YcgR